MPSLSKLISAARVLGRNVALGGSVASLALLREPTTVLAHASESLFLYKTMGDRRGIPQKFVFEVLPCEPTYPLSIANFQSDEGWMKAIGSYSTDLISLCQLCHCINPKRIFEIGTLRGYTALHMGMNTAPECQILTLDLPKDGQTKPVSKLRTTLVDDVHVQMPVTKYHFSGTPWEKKIQLLFGDSAEFDFTPYEKNIDVFFIDGAHSYEYVRSDSERALRCVRPGGVIAWHDFGRVGLNGVSKYVLQLSRSMEIYSVPGGSLAFTII